MLDYKAMLSLREYWRQEADIEKFNDYTLIHWGFLPDILALLRLNRQALN